MTVQSVAPIRLGPAVAALLERAADPVELVPPRSAAAPLDEPEAPRPRRPEAIPCRAPEPSAERLLCHLHGPDHEYYDRVFEGMER